MTWNTFLLLFIKVIYCEDLVSILIFALKLGGFATCRLQDWLMATRTRFRSFLTSDDDDRYQNQIMFITREEGNWGKEKLHSTTSHLDSSLKLMMAGKCLRPLDPVNPMPVRYCYYVLICKSINISGHTMWCFQVSKIDQFSKNLALFVSVTVWRLHGRRLTAVKPL